MLLTPADSRPWATEETPVNQHQQQIDALFAAELQFRLASAVRLASSVGKQPFDLPAEWVHGKHRVRYGEVALRKDQGDFAAWCLHHSATYMLAMAAKDAIRLTVPDPKNSVDLSVRSAYQIARLIRNAFAHAPFNPVWSIDPDCRDQIFEVPSIIRLDTTGLNGQRFDWRHYGGPLALLHLAHYVRYEILADEPKERTVLPIPEAVYFQQGHLILERVKRKDRDG